MAWARSRNALFVVALSACAEPTELQDHAAYAWPPPPGATPPAPGGPSAAYGWPAPPPATYGAYPGYAPAPQPAGASPRFALAPGARGQPGAWTGGPIYEPDPEGRPSEILREDAPNVRYAALDQAACEAELTRRGAPFVRAEPTEGVMAPTRLRGPLRGVSIHSGLAAAAREHAPMEVFDCRLVLALDDFAAMASARGVVEMIHLSAYRPRSAHGCTPKYDGMQHCGALAVDIGTFRRSDGSEWSVVRDFHGKIGTATCGPTAHPSSHDPASSGLWSLVCDAAAAGIFHVVLTPNHNQEHNNHFHVEITPKANWMLIQ